MNEHWFWAKLAEHPLWIRTAYSYTWMKFSDYRLEPTDRERQMFFEWYGKEEPIFVTQEEIRQEQHQTDTVFSEAYLESLALYRKLLERMSLDDVMMFHCSALTLDGRAYLFTAPSGTGKSTHAGLWRKRFGERVVMVNDDKPLLGVRGEKIIVYGSPYSGKEQLQTNTAAPVDGIVVLYQNPENIIRPLDAREAFPHLLIQSHRPRNAEGMHHILDILNRMTGLPVYSLGCTISDEAVRMAYQALTGGMFV